MSRNRKILFGVDAGENEGGRYLFPVRPRRSRATDVALWGGIAMLSILFIVLMLYKRANLHPFMHMEHNSQVRYMRSHGEAAMKEIVSTFLHPEGKRDLVITYLKLVNADLGADVHDELLAALPEESKSELNCLVSLALCLNRDYRGLPRFMYVLSAAKPGSRRFKSANFFDSPEGERHPLEKYYESDDDVEWAVKIVQDALKHVFPGATPEKCRDSILAWWKESSNGTMEEWQRDFLADSPAPWNRLSAFEYFFRRSWGHPDMLRTAVEAMKREKDVPLRRYMALRLFRRGVRETIPVLDEYIRNAADEKDYAEILRVLPVFIEMPDEFASVDRWRGARDDVASFEWFREWWDRNRDLLVFRDSRWHATGMEEENPEERLLDSNAASK